MVSLKISYICCIDLLVSHRLTIRKFPASSSVISSQNPTCSLNIIFCYHPVFIDISIGPSHHLLRLSLTVHSRLLSFFVMEDFTRQHIAPHFASLEEDWQCFSAEVKPFIRTNPRESKPPGSLPNDPLQGAVYY